MLDEIQQKRTAQLDQKFPYSQGLMIHVENQMKNLPSTGTVMFGVPTLMSFRTF